MTNDELKEIAKLVVTSDLPLSSVPVVRSLAHGVIRLLRENDAMRKVVDVTKRYLDLYDSESDECDLLNRMDEAHEDILIALSQLEKKTVDMGPEKK